MNEHEVRVEIHAILDSHDSLLSAMRTASAAHDAMLVSAIEANRAALRLLTRLIEEGTEQSS